MTQNGMKAGEFRGKVLTTLDFLKSGQTDQKKDIKEIKTHLFNGSRKIAVNKWMARAALGWLFVITSFLIGKFAT